jgi:hypothetical protein
MKLQEIREKFASNEITGFATKICKYRLFVASNGLLCYFKKGSSRRGFPLEERHTSDFVEYIYEKPEDYDLIVYKKIAKFRKYATKASFVNNFIERCLKLPDTYEKWVNEGKKGLYESGVTTGCTKDGEIISIDALSSILDTNELRDAIKNRRNYSVYRRKFRGYDTTVSLEYVNGDFRGYLSLEYVGCGNGHYYYLINDENFIYTDKD